jgi:hypothetical protein
MPENIIFNQDLALDLMWLDGQATLHIVDTRTHCSSAAIIKRQTVEGVWYEVLEAWATLYLGYPDTFKLDQGSVFTSPRCKKTIRYGWN